MTSRSSLPGGNGRRLGFNLPDDLTDLPQQSAQELWDREPLEAINFAKGYVEGDLAAIVRLRTAAPPGEYHLIFHAVPARHGHLERPAQRAPQLARTDRCANSEIEPVFSGVRYLAECGEQVVASGVPVPSRVWLKTAQGVVKLFRDDFAVLPTQAAVEIGGSCGEEERDVALGRSVDLLGGSVHRLIQGALEVDQHAPNQHREASGKLPNDADYMEVFARIRINIEDLGVWLGLKEGGDLVFCSARVFLRPSKGILGALERV